MGIPIGPDTSLIIAEIIAAAVDERLMDENVVGVRFMDDFEIACETRRDAEQSLEKVERALCTRPELAINPLKTAIHELPLALDYHWRRDIADVKFSQGENTSRRDVIRFFDKTFELQENFPGTSDCLRNIASPIGPVFWLGLAIVPATHLPISSRRASGDEIRSPGTSTSP